MSLLSTLLLLNLASPSSRERRVQRNIERRVNKEETKNKGMEEFNNLLEKFFSKDLTLDISYVKKEKHFSFTTTIKNKVLTFNDPNIASFIEKAEIKQIFPLEIIFYFKDGKKLTFKSNVNTIEEISMKPKYGYNEPKYLCLEEQKDKETYNYYWYFSNKSNSNLGEFCCQKIKEYFNLSEEDKNNLYEILKQPYFPISSSNYCYSNLILKKKIIRYHLQKIFSPTKFSLEIDMSEIINNSSGYILFNIDSKDMSLKLSIKPSDRR